LLLPITVQLLKFLGNKAGWILLAPPWPVKEFTDKNTDVFCLSTSARQTAKPPGLCLWLETITQFSMICQGDEILLECTGEWWLYAFEWICQGLSDN